MENFLIRPASPRDLGDLFDLAVLSGNGFSSLQADIDFLGAYIEASGRNFEAAGRPSSVGSLATAKFLLVLEDLSQSAVVGCAAVKNGVGVDAPFMNFQCCDRGMRPVSEVDTNGVLLARSDFEGATEIGSLFLHPDYRKSGIGRYLAKSRYMLIAAAPTLFSSLLVSEIRGQTTPEGDSLFYNAVFKQRLHLTFREADELYGAGLKPLDDIVPAAPFQVAALPASVKSTLGTPHATASAAYRMLLSEGFAPTGAIDLFDAGPIIAAHRDLVTTTRQSAVKTVYDKPKFKSSAFVLAATPSISQFRAVVTAAGVMGEDVALAPETLDRLYAQPGDRLRIWESPPAKAPMPPQPVEAMVHV